jgi:hypothetical protein
MGNWYCRMPWRAESAGAPIPQTGFQRRAACSVLGGYGRHGAGGRAALGPAVLLDMKKGGSWRPAPHA